jgi:putative oxidoreductase
MKFIGQRHWLFNLYTLLMRLVLAIVIFPYGAQKVFGWFGSSYNLMTDRFMQWSNIPNAMGDLIAWAVMIAAVLLVLGFFTRIAALALAILAVVAILVPAAGGSFMSWYSTQQGEGVEFFLLVATIATVLCMTGAGGIRVGSLFKNPFSRSSGSSAPKQPRQPAMAS